MITSKGRQLAQKLSASIATTSEVLEICSKLCRHAKSYHRIMEAECNGHSACHNPSLPIATVSKLQAEHEKWCERRSQQLEKRIRKLCYLLPLIDGERITPIFNGDPRAAVVKLKMPDGRYDDWGKEGICV